MSFCLDDIDLDEVMREVEMVQIVFFFCKKFFFFCERKWLIYVYFLYVRYLVYVCDILCLYYFKMCVIFCVNFVMFLMGKGENIE